MSRPTRAERFARVVLIAFALVAAAQPARAAIPEIMWEPAETVDAPVEVVPGSPGVSVLDAGGVWHIVYEKSGEIFVRARADTGWLEPQQLSSDPSASRSPHIAVGGGFLHVVWEDERSGRAEVWSRWRDGVSWSPEECLSCDSDASRAPAIGGAGNVAFVAWEEDGAAPIAIVGRRFEGGAWSLVEPISAGAAAAIEPSVTVHPGSEIVAVAWSDGRHGDEELYLRRSTAASTWSAEERLTDLAGSNRRPSIHAEECCPDIAYDVLGFAFENDESGVSEIYGSCWAEGSGVSEPQRLSADDGIASARPNLSAFNLVIAGFPFGGFLRTYLPTWSDETPSGRRIVVSRSQDCVASEDSAIVSVEALSYSAAGAIEGNPNAEILVAWVEERDGVHTLVAQRGLLRGYVAVEGGQSADDAPRLTLAPNPARAHVALRIESPTPARADVRIVDPAGRIVRDLGRRQLSAGPNAVAWDTKDDTGRRVASGRYYAVVHVGETVLRQKLSIAR